MTARAYRAGGSDAPSSVQLQAQASRTLTLLQAIESTVERLVTNTELVTSISREMSEFLDVMRAGTPALPLDMEGRASELLTKAGDSAERQYLDAIARREHARADRQLTGEDGVEDAYTAFIGAVAGLHNVIVEMRDTLQICGALHSKRGDIVYSDAARLMADILAGH